MTELGTREHWGSRIGFILASAGCAVGLGNIWRFPTTAGDNGGGLFVLIYLTWVFVLGVPVMLAEFTIGRAAQSNAVGSFRKLAPRTPWFMLGGMGVLVGFMILSFYAVVGGWIIGYVFSSISGTIVSGLSPTSLGNYFELVAQDPLISIFFFFVFMAVTIMIVYAGVGEGIERWSKILMPILLVLFVLVIARGLTLPNAFRGLEFLFVPRMEDFKPDTMSAALGQAFFSLSLGMGAMITYGGYLKRHHNLPNSAIQVVGLDSMVALLAGLAIFPAFFSINPGVGFHEAPGGEGLIFTSFPQIFLQMFGGDVLMAQLFGTAFFSLILIAALTSSISLLEVVVAYFVDERGWARRNAAVIMGLITFLLGIPSALSNVAADKTFKVLGISFFDLMLLIANEYLLPLGALMISVFVAWKWGKKAALEEARTGGSVDFRLGELWFFILRWIAPFIIAQIIALKILSDLRGINVIAVSKEFVDNLQWVLTSVNAIILAGIVISGVYLWFVRSRKKTE